MTGDTVTVPVMLDVNHFLVSGELDVTFDSTKLELVAVNDDEANPYVDEVNSNLFTGIVSSRLTGDGVVRVGFATGRTGKSVGAQFFTLTFKVIDENAGEAAISLAVNEAYADQGDGEYEPIVEVQNGSVVYTKATTT
ncbi:MAG: hypothetical protein E7553_02035, partial [Ruminococcaceae bacterium]|nr:hypothetical protein [Oscillospiraceae bacterium]